MCENGENTGYMGTQRPTVEIQHAREIIAVYYGLKSVEIVEIHSSGDRNFKVTTLQDGDQIDYILKVVNSKESIPDLHETIESIVNRLQEHGFVTSKMIPSKDGKPFLCLPIPTTSGKDELCLVKLMTYLPGVPQRSLTTNSTTQYQLGQLLALFHQTAKDFPSSGLTIDPNNPWAAENPLAVLIYLTPSLSKEMVKLVKKISETLDSILKTSTHLTKGIIHGDFHDLNIIVNPQHSTSNIKQRYGIIDFNDVSYSFTILEVGRLIADQLIAYTSKKLKKKQNGDNCLDEREDPDMFRKQLTSDKLLINLPEFNNNNLDDQTNHEMTKVDKDVLIGISIQILKGYLSVTELSPVDLSVLYCSVAGAFSQYLVLCEYNKLHQPENPFAAQASRETDILILEWDQINPDTLLERISNIA